MPIVIRIRLITRTWFCLCTGPSTRTMIIKLLILEVPLQYMYVFSCKHIVLSFFQGQLFKNGRILCMECLGDHRLILGTQIGKVWVFDTSKNKLLHASAQLKDSVLSLKHVKGYETS